MRSIMVLIAMDVLVLGCTGAPSTGDGAMGDAATTGRCTSAAQCDEHIDCTEDTCVGGTCAHAVVPARCAAGASCDPRTGCRVGAPCATDTDCRDMDPCTTRERCDSAARVCLFDVLDGDGDHFPPRSCGGGDCDDSMSTVNPGASEACNGRDDNCDGRIDEQPLGRECTAGETCRGGSCTHCARSSNTGCVDPCCSGGPCGAGTCRCSPVGGACTISNDCCAGWCVRGICVACLEAGSVCTGGDCCAGSCAGGHCCRTSASCTRMPTAVRTTAKRTRNP